MIRKFALYNYKFFYQKQGETEDFAWFSTSGVLALGFAFNISTVLFYYLGNYRPDIRFENPGYILFGIPWIIMFLFFFFNYPLKRKVLKEKAESIDKKWKIVYWVYYIATGLIYSYFLSYYSKIYS